MHPHSSRGYSRSSRSMNYEYSRHRRGSSASDRHQGQDTVDTNGRQFSTMENESHPRKHKHEERRRSDHGDGGKYDDRIRSRKHRSDRREPGSSDWPSDLTDTDVSKGPSGSKSSSWYDDHEKSRRKSSEDQSHKRRCTVHKSSGKEHSSTRGSKHGTEDDYYGEKDDNKYSDDRWVATYSDADSDVERYQRSSSGGTKFGRKDNAHSDAEVRHQRSSRRRKADKRRKTHSGNKQLSTTEEDTTDSDTRDLSSDSWSCRSRSSEENFSTLRSKRKRSQSKEKVE